MLVHETDDLGFTYPDLLLDVLDDGELSRPRGMEVMEVRPLLLRLTRPEACLVTRPGISRALMWMEAAQMIGGTYDGGVLARISQQAADLMTPHGAYGPRVSSQLLDVVRELTDDPDSRRAIVHVGRENDLLKVQQRSEREVPCTVSWQFMVRHGRLEMTVNMRSWDLVWGLTNDVPCFVAVQMCVADALGVELGPYSHLAGNAHVYERHFDLRPTPVKGKTLANVAASHLARDEGPIMRMMASQFSAVCSVDAASSGRWGDVLAPWDGEPMAAWVKKLAADVG